MISKEILGFLCIKMVFQLETPTLISTVRWSDTKAHSETLLFSDSKTKSDLLFFPDRHLSQSGLNREGAWSYCSELYLPPFFSLKTHPFLHSMVQLKLHSREMTFKCETKEGKSCSFWLSTTVPAAGGSTETKSMTLFSLSITLYEKITLSYG